MNDIGENEWAAASLQIISKTLTIEQITAIVGHSPSRAFEMGSLTSPRNSHSEKRSANLWILESNLEDNGLLEDHIDRLLNVIERNITGFQNLMNECKVNIFCGYSSGDQGGFVLSSQLIKRLSVIPITLNFDLYPIRSSS